jgi:HPt (histidine-containing phosphotransfer) domain-containing protein
MNIDMIVYGSLTRTLAATGQLETVVNIFNRNLAERRAALKDAYNLDERGKIKDIAHALKGSCGMFGANRCADLCQEIENAALTVDQPLPADLLIKLSGALDTFNEFLTQDLEKNRSTTLH